MSKRKSKLREKWKTRELQEAATLEDVQTRYPKLFEGVCAASEDAGVKTEPIQVESEASASRSFVPAMTPPKVESLPSRNVDNSMDLWTEPPAAPPEPKYLTYETPTSVPEPQLPPPQPPKPALSDLLQKKRLPHEDPELFGSDMRPNPVQQRNPFQTATDRLKHDRMTGRARNTDDDQPRSGNGRRRNRGQPPPGVYHPVNQNLLLGGGGDYDDDDDYNSGSSGVGKKFVSPINNGGGDRIKKQATAPNDEEDVDPRLKSCDPELIEKIEMEIVDSSDPVTFDDIAGLKFAKKCVNELVIWPMARPDIFTGLRTLPKGLLLFGPPGTGKTLIGKAIANQSKATFFNISASSLTSKWIGQGEKLVRTLFAVAAVKQPSVIFIDEIDSLLTQRSSEENEASRRMKTEFLVQLDGAGTKAKDVILVIGATNRPQELDEAARRRFVKRLYIPLPSFEARLDLVSRLLKDNKNDLTDEDKTFIAHSTKGYSGADVRALCTEAAMGPIRNCADIRTMNADTVRAINLDDFKEALRGVRSSVATKDLAFYKEWNEEFGSFAFERHEE